MIRDWRLVIIGDLVIVGNWHSYSHSHSANANADDAAHDAACSPLPPGWVTVWGNGMFQLY